MLFTAFIFCSLPYRTFSQVIDLDIFINDRFPGLDNCGGRSCSGFDPCIIAACGAYGEATCKTNERGCDLYS